MMEYETPNRPGACIKIIGVGGGGGNAVNTMIEERVDGVEFIAANTDIQALSVNQAETHIQIGEQRTRGLGAGSNPEVGRDAAQESASLIQEQLKGADMVFITAGMGGGTGSGAAPIIAGIAKQLGALTVGVVTKPFRFEGKRRQRIAEEAIATLTKNVDTLITIPNERLMQIAGDQLTLLDAFKTADSVLVHAVRSISDLIQTHGQVNLDFADVTTVMKNKGMALMGTGVGEGPNRATDAAEAAISSPLLDGITLQGAKSVLLNITAPRSASLHEIGEAATLIEESLSEDALLIWGHVVRDDDSEEIKVTIIATEFDNCESGAETNNTSSSAIPNHYMDGMNRGSFGSPYGIPAQPAQPTMTSANSNPGMRPVSTPGIAATSRDFLSDQSLEFANKLQELDAQANLNAASVQQSQPTPNSYMPGNLSNTYAAPPTVNIYEPVQNVRPNTAQYNAVQQPSRSSTISSAVSRAATESSPARSAVNEIISKPEDTTNEEDFDVPAYLRRKPKNNFFLGD